MDQCCAFTFSFYTEELSSRKLVSETEIVFCGVVYKFCVPESIYQCVGVRGILSWLLNVNLFLRFEPKLLEKYTTRYSLLGQSSEGRNNLPQPDIISKCKISAGLTLGSPRQVRVDGLKPYNNCDCSKAIYYTLLSIKAADLKVDCLL